MPNKQPLAESSKVGMVGSQDRNAGMVAGEVHIWRVPLCGQAELIPTCRNLLSADEVQRADRFHFEKDRHAFIIARAAMRQILARYGNVPPQNLIFSYGPKGKPELSPELNFIKFNLSHSQEFALLAVAQGLCLGIDIEFVNQGIAVEEIAKRFFSANEINALGALAGRQKVEAFFSCWTRKEAYIKALGEGLSVPLDSFDVAFDANAPAALLRVRSSPGEVLRWSMYDIVMPPVYKAAVVVEGKTHRLRNWQWQLES
jgi:4'-phosphopantetheinyl transferase